jgi:hypothetical protein
MPSGTIVEPEHASLVRALPDEVEVTLGEEFRDRFRDRQQICFRGFPVIDASEFQTRFRVVNETAMTGG